MPKILKKLLGGVDMREPYQSELDYFMRNTHVGGMAAEDNRVVINPYSFLNMKEKEAVEINEAARVLMRTKYKPSFSLTDEQQTQFKNYSNNPQDVVETVAARLVSGDPSAGFPTVEQNDFVSVLRKVMGLQ
jgi:hypothetical protein